MNKKDKKESALYQTADDLIELSPGAIKTLFWLVPRVLSGGFNSDIPTWDHQRQTVIDLEEGYKEETGIETSAARYSLLELLRILEKRGYIGRFKIEHASDWIRGDSKTPYGVAAVYDHRKYTREIMEMGIKTQMILLENIYQNAFESLDGILSSTSQADLIASRGVFISSVAEDGKSPLALKEADFTTDGFTFIRADGSSDRIKFYRRSAPSKKARFLSELWKNRRIYVNGKVKDDGDDVALGVLARFAGYPGEDPLIEEIRRMNLEFAKKRIMVSIKNLGKRSRLELHFI